MALTWRTIDDQAERLGISRRVIQHWLANGMKHSKVGGVVRISDQQADEFLLQHETSRHVIDDTVNEVLAGLT